MLGRWEFFERPVLEGIPHPIGWHSVAGPHLTARELGKCSDVSSRQKIRRKWV